jgi:hypothetical protein
MRRVKGTLRGLDPTLLRVKGHRDLTDPTLTLAGSDPGTVPCRVGPLGSQGHGPGHGYPNYYI